MNIWDIAIIRAANQLKPGEQGYEIAQQWKREIEEKYAGTKRNAGSMQVR